MRPLFGFVGQQKRVSPRRAPLIIGIIWVNTRDDGVQLRSSNCAPGTMRQPGQACDSRRELSISEKLPRLRSRQWKRFAIEREKGDGERERKKKKEVWRLLNHTWLLFSFNCADTRINLNGPAMRLPTLWPVNRDPPQRKLNYIPGGLLRKVAKD